MAEDVWTLRGADERLTLIRRPQGCIDLVLDGDRPVAYLTGRGRPITDILSTVGVAHLLPAGPYAFPVPPSAVEALADLVAAMEDAGVVPPPREWKGPRIDPPSRPRGVVADLAGDVDALAGALIAVLAAYEKAKAVLGTRPAQAPATSPVGHTTRRAV